MSKNSGAPTRPGARAGSIEFTLTMPWGAKASERRRARGPHGRGGLGGGSLTQLLAQGSKRLAAVNKRQTGGRRNSLLPAFADRVPSGGQYRRSAITSHMDPAQLSPLGGVFLTSEGALSETACLGNSRTMPSKPQNGPKAPFRSFQTHIKHWRRALSDKILYCRLARRRAMEPHCFCSGIADTLGEIRRRK